MLHRRLLAFTGLALLACSPLGFAATQVTAEHGWIRLLPGDLPAAGYVVLHNEGNQAAVLTSATTPRYSGVMLHVSSTRNGSATMQMVPQLAIHARSSLRLTPGSFHLMLTGASAPIPKVGDVVTITLHFDGGQALAVPFTVRPAYAEDDGSGTAAAPGT
ncbi:copper chaperone PCu(A)C [Frateuria aurantia]